MSVNFIGRTVIVTGAGRCLGKAYAIDLAARGARVVVNDIGASLEGDSFDNSVALAVADAIRMTGGQAIASSDDVASPEGAKRIVRSALESFGSIDALLTNAGNTIRMPFDEMTAEDFAAVYNVHVLGCFNCCKAVWPVMKAKGYGRIVNTTSVSGAYGMRNQIYYSTAKAGIIGFTRALALEGLEHAF